MEYFKIALALLVSFFCGSIPTAYLMGKKIKGLDIRQFGSGNVGATNAFRVLGKGWGTTCLVLDVFKGWLPTMMLGALLVSEHSLHWPSDAKYWAVGLAAILGHMFTPFLKFKGGKGVATSLGVVLAIAPLPVLIVAVVAVMIIWLTKYVSLASIIGSALLPLMILILQFKQDPWTSVTITTLLGLMIIWKHRSNIQRLRAGTEKRLNDKTTAQAAQADKKEQA